MILIPELIEVVSYELGIDLPSISEVKSEWKSSLLRGNMDNRVTLYLGNDSHGDQFLISRSNFSKDRDLVTYAGMVEEKSLGVGYPMFYIKEALGLKDIPMKIAYSLLYKSASLILEAERLEIKNSVLILDTTKLTESFDIAYQKFAKLLCFNHQINHLHKSNYKGRANFYFGLFNINNFDVRVVKIN